VFLYYITDRTQLAADEDTRRRRLLEKIAAAARSGVDLVQLREKDLAARELESLACQAVHVIHENSGSAAARTRLLINSRADVAISVGADGVHLRGDDVAVQEVREVWTRRATSSPVISVSCHTPGEVARALSQGADFAVFAPVFEKQGSSAATTAGLGALREVCQYRIPVLALGGVTLANVRDCVNAGAKGIAAIRLFQENDIAGVVASLRSPR